jgi:hypothetical protein
MTTATEQCNGTFPAQARPAASYYLSRGVLPIPVGFRSKIPTAEAWEQLRPAEADLDTLFPSGTRLNIGLLLGEPSHGLIDADLDCPQSIAAAPFFLPLTGWVSGRQSAPRSHYWYRVSEPPAKASTGWLDFNRKKLLELRSTGGQTVAPPSLHEDTGEAIEWRTLHEPAEVSIADLMRACQSLAAAALLARHWPAEGSRQDAALALAGGLLRGGLAQEQAERLVSATALAAGDEEHGKRAAAVGSTARTLAEGGQVTGWPRLAELLGPSGGVVAARVREWLGLTVRAEATDFTPEPLPWPEPPAEEVFYGLAGDTVRAVGPASEADPAALLLQVLVGFGNLLGRSAHCTVEADRHYGNESVVLVGQTSKGRKGTSWSHIRHLLAGVDDSWAKERVLSGLSSGEGVIWQVRDPIAKRERVKEHGAPVRYEDVEADPGVSDKRLLMVEPEFASVLKQLERQGNILSAVLRQAWDTGDLATLTKNSPARATVIVSQRRSSARDHVARSDSLHVDVEGAGAGTTPGSPAQHRWRRAGRSWRSRWRTPGRVGLPNRLLSLLAA